MKNLFIEAACSSEKEKERANASKKKMPSCQRGNKILPCKHFQLAQWLLQLAPSSQQPEARSVNNTLGNFSKTLGNSTK